LKKALNANKSLKSIQNKYNEIYNPIIEHPNTQQLQQGSLNNSF